MVVLVGSTIVCQAPITAGVVHKQTHTSTHHRIISEDKKEAQSEESEEKLRPTPLPSQRQVRSLIIPPIAHNAIKHVTCKEQVII